MNMEVLKLNFQVPDQPKRLRQFPAGVVSVLRGVQLAAVQDGGLQADPPGHERRQPQHRLHQGGVPSGPPSSLGHYDFFYD